MEDGGNSNTERRRILSYLPQRSASLALNQNMLAFRKHRIHYPIIETMDGGVRLPDQSKPQVVHVADERWKTCR